MNSDKDRNGYVAEVNPNINKHPPIWQELVIELFFRPGEFFKDLSILLQPRYVIPVCWIYGMSSAIDRIDQQIFRKEIGNTTAQSEFITSLAENWIFYWVFVLASGAISGLFLWWIGGWWYRKRLQWSGAVDPDPRLARVVYVYASFVLSAPMVINSLIATMVYDNYSQAYYSEESWSLLFLIFPFWSLFTSYRGSRTCFAVSKWKARIWFIILPFLLYLISFGVIVGVLMMLDPEIS